MIRHLGVKARLTLCVVAVVVFTTIANVILQTRAAMEMARTEALRTAEEMAYHHGAIIEAELDEAIGVARTLADLLQSAKVIESGLQLDRDLTNNLLRATLEKNPKLFATWTCWEPNAFDALDMAYKSKPGHDATGRYIPYYLRAAGDIQLRALRNYDGQKRAEDGGEPNRYAAAAAAACETMLEPYEVTEGGRKVTLVSFVVPVCDTRVTPAKVLGAVGVDMDIAPFREAITRIRPYGGGSAALVTNSGIIAAHLDSGMLGQDFSESCEGLLAKDAIRRGEEFAGLYVMRSGAASDTVAHQTGVSIQVGATKTPWAFVVNVPMDLILAQPRRLRFQAIMVGVFACAVAMLVSFLIVRGITRPLNQAADTLVGMEAKNDLARRLEVTSEDEIGILAKGFNRYLDKVQAIVKSVSGHMGALAATSTQLSANSDGMSAGAKNTAAKANAVASAAEEMSATAAAVATSMAQAASGLTTVSSATEEMTSTISDLASNAEKARTITVEATTQAERVGTVVSHLGAAAQEIGKVTEAITSISSKTNLLALNATIEAARAGTAGKGFAVVANEIKGLAEQTANATEGIKRMVTDIQTSATSTIDDIRRITTVIGEVNDIVTTIATAISQQAAVTKDIAGSIGQVSAGVKDANEQTSQVTVVSQAIAKDIAVVNEAAGDMDSGSAQVQSSAAELSRMAEQLQAMVAQFSV